MGRSLNFIVILALTIFVTFIESFSRGISIHRLKSSLSAATTDASSSFKLLVLGGTGYVGREVVRRARAKGMTVVSISRRGKLLGETDESVTWVSGDAAEVKTVQAVIDDLGPFDGCVHAVGVLFNSPLNRFVSGSGSMPDSESTYDRVIRQTGATAIKCFAAEAGEEVPKPFVYISAAEAGWSMTSPLPMIERYLVAKRAVEDQVMTNKALRPVILRPSLVWNWNKPQALPAVVPFYLASVVGIPFVDKPIQLSTIADSAIGALQDPVVRGILRAADMRAVAAKVTRVV
jgi:nucleoside-diphosphate-sugar epimerase